jgi:hypothetical protein
MYNLVFGVQKVKKRDEKLACITKKGAKKLVSSSYTKILVKDSNN